MQILKFIMLLLLIPAVVWAQEAPPGWEFPQDRDFYYQQPDLNEKCREFPAGQHDFCLLWQKAYAKYLDEFRQANSRKYIRGDFNGDGVEDQASLLINRAADEIAVFVTMPGSGKQFPLFKRKLSSSRFLLEESFQSVQPSDFLSKCEEMDQRCRLAEKTWGFNCDNELQHCRMNYDTLKNLKYDAIWIFSFGDMSGNNQTNEIRLRPHPAQSVFFWNKNSNSFDQILVGESIIVNR